MVQFHLLLQSELPGFYDPCIGEDKELSIMYEFRRKRHYCRVSDKTNVHIPARGKDHTNFILTNTDFGKKWIGFNNAYLIQSCQNSKHTCYVLVMFRELKATMKI